MAAAAGQPASVRVSLMITHDNRLLLERRERADGTVEYTLPSVGLDAGRTLKDAAYALGARALGTVSNLRFQRLSLVPESGARAAHVSIGLYAEPGPGAAPISDRWAFVPLESLPEPLEADAAVALRACHERLPAIDLDGQPLPVGFGLAAAPSPPPSAGAEAVELDDSELAARMQSMGNGPLMLVGGLLFAGGAAWVTGVVVGLEPVLRYDTDLAMLALLLWGVVMMVLAPHTAFRQQPYDSNGERIARVLGTVVAGMLLGGGLVFFAATIGGNDARTAFWLWFFGAFATTIALAFVRRARRTALSQAPRRLAVWAALTVASLLSVFPPLREGIVEAFDRDGHQGERAGDPELLFPEEE
jgi:ADP-ribose pyrophosphatase YjhB (NUDIX family)/FtsH-binding integral membrane protein